MPLSDRLLALIRNPETPAFVLRDACAEEEPPVAKVYVVSGQTGEYSDHTSWTVAAYLDRAQADAFCEQLNGWCADNQCGQTPRGTRTSSMRGILCPLDPGFHCDYTGTSYEVWEIPLRVGEGE